MSDPTPPAGSGPETPPPGPRPTEGTTPPPPIGYASPGTGGYPGPYTGPAPDGDARIMALLAHLLGILTSFLGPLIIWLVKKDVPFVDDQGKEALNFHLTMLIAWVAVILLTCVTFGLGALLIIPVWIVVLIFAIIAAVEANKGNAYRYPVNIRMVK